MTQESIVKEKESKLTLPDFDKIFDEAFLTLYVRDGDPTPLGKISNITFDYDLDFRVLEFHNAEPVLLPIYPFAETSPKLDVSFSMSDPHIACLLSGAEIRGASLDGFVIRRKRGFPIKIKQSINIKACRFNVRADWSASLFAQGKDGELIATVKQVHPVRLRLLWACVEALIWNFKNRRKDE